MDPDIAAGTSFDSLFSCGQVSGLMVVVLYCVLVPVNLIKFNISKQLKRTVAKYGVLC